ncbi:hypothetical protein [Mycobacterium marinum]|uniref:hypothetical protein n=1 Tax=Mycobacterium marinum TaxID=1781 RepID=UPI0023586401|nr:hypothetical protein [Mycobacterium marinum]MDC8985520.1 hypothetical protein [Mycobacterium marinum]MDC9002836.1 hypothetical protein [Mycobacterium marinum]MDC9013557.1 hypothetical protein [Mycobacterium marinum]MDC9018907.1 hypothetical protein [Mycobacterium marinum]
MANIVRTDADAHLPLADTAPAHAVRVLPRDQQDAVSVRQQSAIRSATGFKTSVRPPLPRSRGYPKADRPDPVQAPFRLLPHPAQTSALTPVQLHRLLIKAGRQGLPTSRDIEQLRAIFIDTYLDQPPVMQHAVGLQLSALLRHFDPTPAAADQRNDALAARLITP